MSSASSAGQNHHQTTTKQNVVISTGAIPLVGLPLTLCHLSLPPLCSSGSSTTGIQVQLPILGAFQSTLKSCVIKLQRPECTGSRSRSRSRRSTQFLLTKQISFVPVVSGDPSVLTMLATMLLTQRGLLVTSTSLLGALDALLCALGVGMQSLTGCTAGAILTDQVASESLSCIPPVLILGNRIALQVELLLTVSRPVSLRQLKACMGQLNVPATSSTPNPVLAALLNTLSAGAGGNCSPSTAFCPSMLGSSTTTRQCFAVPSTLALGGLTSMCPPATSTSALLQDCVLTNVQELITAVQQTDTLRILQKQKEGTKRCKEVCVTVANRTVQVIPPPGCSPFVTPTPPPSRTLVVGTCATGSAGNFATIQLAVNAASPGDIIQVCPGTYVEQVTIPASKSNITLLSIVPLAAIIKAPATVVFPGAIVDVDGATNVTIADFTITGPVFPIGARFEGILVRAGGSATIVGNHIQLIRDATFPSGVQAGIGIVVGGFSTVPMVAGPGTACIVNNVIDTYQKGGILVNLPGSSAEVRNNTVLGTPNNIIAQNGIQVSRGALAVLLRNISNENLFLLHTASATGILLFESVTGLQLRQNITKFDDIGIASTGTIAGVSNSLFCGNTSNNNTLDGIFFDTNSSGNTVVSNTFLGNMQGFDVNDLSTGTGTCGTADIYSANRCRTDNRSGCICQACSNTPATLSTVGVGVGITAEPPRVFSPDDT